MAAGEMLDQAVAIRLSQEVIRRSGNEPKQFELVPLTQDSPGEPRYFGTSNVGPPHGYVMWRNMQPSRGRRGLTVSIELSDRIAICKLSWWH